MRLNVVLLRSLPLRLFSAGSWQPTVPAWEKEFCKVVGSMDWETLLQLKKFMHLYDNVMEWNDSAGEEAFSNAKRRYWAKKNSLSCDISLPDPDLYIDKIDWDSEIDHEEFVAVESLPMTPETEEDHDPVVIFGDCALPNQDLADLPPSGWGDDEDYLVPPVTHSSTNNADPWGHSSNEWAAAAWLGYSNDGWQGYSNDAWQYNNGGGHGYMPWEGWNWNCADNYNYVGPDVRDTWNDDNNNNNNNVPSTGSGGRVSSFKAPRVRANEQRRKHTPKGHDKAPYKRSGAREWSSNSIAVGQTWDQE